MDDARYVVVDDTADGALLLGDTHLLFKGDVSAAAHDGDLSLHVNVARVVHRKPETGNDHILDRHVAVCIDERRILFFEFLYEIFFIAVAVARFGEVQEFVFAVHVDTDVLGLLPVDARDAERAGIGGRGTDRARIGLDARLVPYAPP